MGQSPSKTDQDIKPLYADPKLPPSSSPPTPATPSLSQPVKEIIEPGPSPSDAVSQPKPTQNVSSLAPKPSGNGVTPPENANLIPGQTANTAGGHGTRDATLIDAVKTIQPQDFLQIHKLPCARDGLMFGMIVGSSVGALMGIWGKPIMKCCNWTVGTFCSTAFGAHQICTTRRQYEKDGMAQARAMASQLKEKKLEEKRKERRMQKEAEDNAAEEKERRRANSWFGWARFW